MRLFIVYLLVYLTFISYPMLASAQSLEDQQRANGTLNSESSSEPPGSQGSSRPLSLQDPPTRQSLQDAQNARNSAPSAMPTSNANESQIPDINTASPELKRMKLIESNSRAFVSTSMGTGRMYGSGIGGDRNLRWQNFELRFGREINPAVLFPDNIFPADGKLRIDFVYYHEGEGTSVQPNGRVVPEHRDGPAVQIVISRPVGDRLSLELGVGPYLGFNTTRDLGGVDYDYTRLGLLVTGALLANIEQFSPGLSLRFSVNQVIMPGGHPASLPGAAHSSTVFMIGLSQQIGAETANKWDSQFADSTPIWVGAGVGNTKTNQGGTSSSQNLDLEVMFYNRKGPWAGSLEFIHEGNDGSLVDRQGVAAQAWFFQYLTSKLEAGIGAGPYFANNKYSSGPEVDGLVSFRADYLLSSNWKVGVDISRILTLHRSAGARKVGTDRDMARLFIMYKYK